MRRFGILRYRFQFIGRSDAERRLIGCVHNRVSHVVCDDGKEGLEDVDSRIVKHQTFPSC